jgi:hypothetical protein
MPYGSHLSLIVALLCLQGQHILALSPTFVPCQIQKPVSSSPLTGCPSGTIFVSQNASDPHAKFTSIQAAIASLYSYLYSFPTKIYLPT